VRAFVVTVPAAAAELATDALFVAGVAAVEERQHTDGGEVVELWTHVGEGDDDVAAVAALLDPAWAWRTELVDDSVVDTWREHAAPVEVDEGLWVVPAWLDPTPPGARPGAMVVPIDPGAAFGLGDHPTTRATLLALRSLIEARGADRVLDVGSGSGVLGIVAALSGAGRVVAIDHQAAAVAATVDNAARNGVGDVVTASATPLAEIDGEFEVVLANLLAPTLVELAAELRRVTAPGGVLVVSGVLEGRHDHVLAALAPMRPVRTWSLDGWAAVALEQPVGA